YYLRFWLGICRTSLAVSALRIMRYCPEMVLTALYHEKSQEMPFTKRICSKNVQNFMISLFYTLHSCIQNTGQREHFILHHLPKSGTII
uniref:hypothetical protein n=1 Tax=Gemmiger qucibialis TaxID=2997294 RepID=UPI003FEDC3A6